MLSIVFEKAAWEEMGWWIKNQPKMAKKIYELIEASAKDPFKGIGKPEMHKGNLTGYWSRRISQEDRLVYKVLEGRIIIATIKGHYQ